MLQTVKAIDTHHMFLSATSRCLYSGTAQPLHDSVTVSITSVDSVYFTILQHRQYLLLRCQIAVFGQVMNDEFARTLHDDHCSSWPSLHTTTNICSISWGTCLCVCVCVCACILCTQPDLSSGRLTPFLPWRRAEPPSRSFLSVKEYWG